MVEKRPESLVYIYIACQLVCLSVRLYPKKVKTAEQIGAKFFAGPRMTPGNVYR